MILRYAMRKRHRATTAYIVEKYRICCMFSKIISYHTSKPAGSKAPPRGSAGDRLRLNDFRFYHLISVSYNFKEEPVDEI